MATRYVGIGGNDGNSGLTWALRKLTLNGAEDTPVVANDLVYVGPGVYREMLTVDVSGGAGTEIVYVADVTGEHTDEVGGIVRITGSDDDQSTNRNYCITGASKDYRTFRGFRIDLSASHGIYNNSGSNWLVEDCHFSETEGDGARYIGADILDCTFRRCMFLGCSSAQSSLRMTHVATVDDTGNVIENCVFAGTYYGMYVERLGGIAVRNCLFANIRAYAIRIGQALAVGQTLDLTNSILTSSASGLLSAVLGDLVEDYNTFFGNATDRTAVNVGANSETYPALLISPILHAGVSQISGFKFPWWYPELSEWSQVQAITGNDERTEELRGIARPVTASKNSWGPCQFFDMERETTTKRTGSVSMAIRDAGRHQIFVPVTATSTTIKVYVYREANYAGNLPQMIIKQPGQADDVTTDTLAHSQWNLLTTTLTPAADPPYVVVELVSRNTNGAADEVFFDDLDVS